MERYSRVRLTNLLHQSPLSIFDLKTLRQTLEIRTESGLFPILKQLVSEQVLVPLTSGLYAKAQPFPDHFEIANYLVTPSYISFESALNYYGILSQFPYIISSATTQKSQTKELAMGSFYYTHISSKLNFGYYKSKGNYLIAYPEKAIIDYIYIHNKNYGYVELDEWDFDEVNPKLLVQYLNQLKSLKGYNSIIKILKEQTPCLPEKN